MLPLGLDPPANPSVTNPNAGSFALEEYKHLSAMFRQNEDAGERRVTLLLTLTTAVSAGLVALLTSKATCFTTDSLANTANGAISALLALGLVTLRRIYKRNQTSDSYKDGMDHIRDYFTESDRRLASYHPFKASKGTSSFWERHRFLNGGLLTITCMLNSAFIAVLGMINVDAFHIPIHIPIGIAGAMIFAASLIVQWIAVERRKTRKRN